MKILGKTMLVLAYAVMTLFFLWLIASVANTAMTNLPDNSATPAWWNFFEMVLKAI